MKENCNAVSDIEKGVLFLDVLVDLLLVGRISFVSKMRPCKGIGSLLSKPSHNVIVFTIVKGNGLLCHCIAIYHSEQVKHSCRQNLPQEQDTGRYLRVDGRVDGASWQAFSVTLGRYL